MIAGSQRGLVKSRSCPANLVVFAKVTTWVDEDIVYPGFSKGCDKVLHDFPRKLLGKSTPR